jgi:transposase
MNEFTIFTAALNIKSPWFIQEVLLKQEDHGEDLHITIGHDKGAKFNYEGADYSVYDHQERTWKHLDFFQHQCYLHAEVPRVKTLDGAVRLVQVPWAEPTSSFTLLFELKLMELVYNGMNQSKAGKTMKIDGRRVSRVINRRVSQALADQPLAPVKELSIDETSTKKGHHYLTVLCDRDRKKVVGLAEGKDVQAVEQALIDMEIRGAYREDIKAISMDMSTGYIAAASAYFEQAEIIFDRFHIMKKMNEAVDQIRRAEQVNCREDFKRTRYWWLRNAEKLKQEQIKRIESLSRAYPNIGEAYRLKELLRSVLNHAYYDHRLAWINDWIKQALQSGIEPIKKFVNMLHNHWYGVKTYFKRLATNAYAESVNLKIQEIKRIARGYSNINNFKLLIYFHLGDLNLGLPTKNS